ncbi:MAG: 3-oxoacyl-ACP reductase FabG [Acidobacteriia bacterium]|nr:3-oxoacyl-ACP reductase FabG [Terriglobia bacterium]
MNPNLRGKVAVVTGASRGLGKAMAVALASEGARVALVSRSAEDLARVAAEITDAGGEAAPFPADVSSEVQVRRIAADIIARFGSVMILINNAGLAMRRPVTELTPDEWRAVLETNLTSAFLMSRSFVPFMKGNGYGRILNIASVMASVSLPGRTAYSASKSALLGFTRSLAQELAPDRITVNTISPGLFATELARPITEDPGLLAQFLANIPLNRPGNPEEIGQLAVYLCSEAAGYITGTDILIDGGWTAR